MTEWTYFVQAETGGPIKVGYTSQAPEFRLANLQTGSPAKLRFVGLLPENREAELHQKWSAHRLHGEWFKPVQAICDFIATEAKSELAKREQLRLESQSVRIESVLPQSVGAAFFEKVFPVKDDFADLVVEFCDEYENRDVEQVDVIEDDDEEIEYDPEFEDDPTFSESLFHLCSILENESFFQAVGVNREAGHIGILCGPCNSRRRMELLKDIGRCAMDIDNETGAWFLFALFWDRGKQIGIDLRLLASGRSAEYVFDPVELYSHSAVETVVEKS